jgi:cytochrome d ubiquinol oxidase subunit I
VSDLLAARSQMAMSLAFHIIFAVMGIGMPLLMVLAERQWIRTRDPVWLDLAKRWSKGTAILFAVGAVSGTVLSFELGLLWPAFMEYAGAIIGMPFSLEGFAFFTEAIFLGIYLYGWTRLTARAHWWAGVAVAVSGTVSGIFVVFANAWMNSPTGFTLVDGKPTDIDPIAAMLGPASFPQALHMTIAAFASTGIAVAGIHAWMLRRDRESTFHRAALKLALLVAVPASLLQLVSGDLSAKFVAKWQPAKLAAMEGHFVTQRSAPLRLGGIPDERTRETRYAIDVPGGLSFLAFGDFDAEVKGLDAFPESDWPPVAITHVAFQVMVGPGDAHGVRVAVGDRLLGAEARGGRLARAARTARAAHAGRVHRRGGGLGGDRGRAPAVDRAGRDAHRGRADADARARGAVRGLHAALRVPRGHRRLAALGADHQDATRSGPPHPAGRLTCSG